MLVARPYGDVARFDTAAEGLLAGFRRLTRATLTASIGWRGALLEARGHAGWRTVVMASRSGVNKLLTSGGPGRLGRPPPAPCGDRRCGRARLPALARRGPGSATRRRGGAQAQLALLRALP